jgi:hypothetical protein
MSADDKPAMQLKFGKRWRCPVCLETEGSEYALSINHGFSPDRTPGYWYDNHGQCFRSYGRLFRLGWYPRGWGWRKDVLEPGEVLTDNEKDRVVRAFGPYRSGRTPDVERIAQRVADVLTPVVYKRLLPSLDAEQMVVAYERTQARVIDRVVRVMNDAIAAGESEGYGFATSESLDRALAGLLNSLGVHSENTEAASA